MLLRVSCHQIFGISGRNNLFVFLTTCVVYNTEAEVGLAIQQSMVPRSEITIITKAAHLDDIEATLHTSLAKLKTSYVDLCVVGSMSLIRNTG